MAITKIISGDDQIVCLWLTDSNQHHRQLLHWTCTMYKMRLHYFLWMTSSLFPLDDVSTISSWVTSPLFPLDDVSTISSGWRLHYFLLGDISTISSEWRLHYFLLGDVSTISSLMTANLLTLNPSKTEFMLIGQHQQLSNIHSPSLSI